MAFNLASGAITQTGNYITATVATAPVFTPTTWSVTATITQAQAGSSTTDTVGRAIFNTSQLGNITTARQVAHSWVSSITAVTLTTVTITGPRYYLASGDIDEFQLAVGNTIAIAQDENDLIAAAIAGVQSRQGGASYSPLVAGTRQDINWSLAPTTQIFLGPSSLGLKFNINGAFCIRGNTQVYQGLATPNQGLTMGAGGAFCLGQAQTYAVGTATATRLVYPAVSWTNDTQSQTHVLDGTFLNQAGYAVFMGTYGGTATTMSSFGGNTNSRTHFRKCRAWSVRLTANTNVGPNIFAAAGVLSIDELELYGTIGTQREGSTYLIYSIINTGGGISQAAVGNLSIPQLIRGYTNLGSDSGIDFRGYQNTIPGTGEATPSANMLISYDSPLGTNVYGTSADATFTNSNSWQKLNLEIKRNLTITNTGSTVNAVNYFKDVTRQVGTVGSLNARGSVLLTGGTQSTSSAASTGVSITAARDGTVIATDGQALSVDRVYTPTSGTNTSVLLGEIYTTNSSIANGGLTANNQNTIGRTGYDGGATGLTTTRVNRRGKDDSQGVRTNRDNYDIFSWSYTGAFTRTSDYSMRTGANGAGGALTIGLITDTDLTETNPTTVAGYASATTTSFLYDYAKYYKVATGTLNGRTQRQRLELGGVDGTDPTAAIANGGGGYLVYPVGSSLMFNDIFSNAIINNSGTTPLTIMGTAVGPVRGSWNGTSYNYGDNLPATPTVQGSITITTGANLAVQPSSKFDTLDFGVKQVTLQTQATALGSWAAIKTTNAINLGTPGTSASWTTTYTPVITGTAVSVAGLGLLAPTTVNATVTTSTDAATHNTKIATALQPLMPAGTTVTAVNTPAGISGTFTVTFLGTFNSALATVTIGFTGNAATGSATSTSGTFFGFNGPGADSTTLAGLLQTAWRNATGSTTATVTGNGTGTTYPSGGQLVTFTLSNAPVPAGATALTFAVTGNTSVSLPTVASSTVGAATNVLNFVVPAVPTAVTIAPVLGGGAVTTPVNTNVINSTMSTTGATIYQPLTSGVGINLLSTSGSIVNGGSSKIAVGFGARTVINVTGEMTFKGAALAGLCNLNIGASNYVLNLVDCGLISTFPFIRTGSGVVFVSYSGDTNITAVLPTGFLALQTVTVTVTLGTPITNLNQIRRAEAYTTPSGSNVPVLQGFVTSPTMVGNTLQWTFTKNLSDQGAFVAFIDGNLPVAGNTTAVSAINLVANSENNVDFGIDTTFASAFITGSTVTRAIPSGSTIPEIQIRVPASTDFDALNLANAKLIIRRIFENVNATSWRRDVARGLFALPQAHFLFNATGTILATGNGIVAPTLGVSMFKAGTFPGPGTSNAIYIQSWNTNGGGTSQYDWNRGGAATTQGVTFNLTYPITSPGPQANITTQDVANIAIAVNTNLSGTATAPLALIARGVEKASLVIPATIAIPPVTP